MSHACMAQKRPRAKCPDACMRENVHKPKGPIRSCPTCPHVSTMSHKQPCTCTYASIHLDDVFMIHNRVSPLQTCYMLEEFDVFMLDSKLKLRNPNCQGGNDILLNLGIKTPSWLASKGCPSAPSHAKEHRCYLAMSASACDQSLFLADMI